MIDSDYSKNMSRPIRNNTLIVKGPIGIIPKNTQAPAAASIPRLYTRHIKEHRYSFAHTISQETFSCISALSMATLVVLG